MITDRSILSIDLGTNLGWAVLQKGSETPRFGLRLLPKPHPAKFVRARREITDLIESWSLVLGDVLALEQPRPVGHQAALVLLGLRAVALLVARDKGLHICEVGPSELKKLATGRGNATKDDVLAAACARYGAEDENEADALWVLEWARQNATITGGAAL